MSWQFCLTVMLLGVMAAAILAGLGMILTIDTIPGLAMAFLAVAVPVAASCSWAWYSPHPGAPCLHTHQETTYMLVGKVLMPMTDDVCDKWGPR